MSRLWRNGIGLLLATLLLSGCQRGARVEVELISSPAFVGSQLLAVPTAVELIDGRGRLYNLPVVRPVQIDLVALATAPRKLHLRGDLPAGRYIGLRLVFDETVWFASSAGGRTALAVDPRSAFADLDIELVAGQAAPLRALLDLDASVIRLGPFQDLHRFLPRLHLLAGNGVGRGFGVGVGGGAGRWTSVAAEVAALQAFVLR